MNKQAVLNITGAHAATIVGGEGVISEVDFAGYWYVAGEAFAVHLDREAIRRGLWKEYPAEDQANQIKIKIDRVLRSLELVPKLPDGSLSDAELAMKENAIQEAYDIINYANFMVRILEGLPQ